MKTMHTLGARAKHTFVRIFAHPVTKAVTALVILAAVVVIILAVSGAFASTAAVVNGEKITQREFNTLIANTEAQYQQELSAEERGLLLDQMVVQTLWLQDARARGITATEEQVDAEYELMLAQFGGTEKEFNDTLRTYGVTVSEVRDQVRDQIVLQQYAQAIQIEEGVTVSDEEVVDFYTQVATTQEGVPALDEVRAEVEQALVQQKLVEVLAQKAEQLRAQATIEVKS